jgi:tRNA-binding EMAP/Myf-like protein
MSEVRIYDRMRRTRYVISELKRAARPSEALVLKLRISVLPLFTSKCSCGIVVQLMVCLAHRHVPIRVKVIYRVQNQVGSPEEAFTLEIIHVVLKLHYSSMKVHKLANKFQLVRSIKKCKVDAEKTD